MKDLLYNGLMLGRNKKVAREEFLVAAGEKSAASFSVPEKEICLQDILKNTGKRVYIQIENEGYMEIEAGSSDAFIRFEDRFISTDEAKDGRIEISFTILADKLHNGKNFGKIFFKTPYQKEEITVIVNNRIKIPGESPRLVFSRITSLYLDFRMGKIPQKEWERQVFEAVGPVNANTPADLFLMLHKAHVHVIAGDFEDPENILEYVEEQLEARQDYPAELFAYFLYVKSLYEKDELLTRAAFDSIKSFYEEKPSWRLLWMMIYTDESFSDDPEKKLSETERLFEQGLCTSPIMYFEAYEVFKNRPGLITRPSLLVIQVLLFAVKYGIAETAPALALSETLYGMSREELLKTDIKGVLIILRDAYEKYPVSSLSNSIAKLLILTGSRSKSDHIFFERAVYDFADIPGLYNYYIFTLDRSEMKIIPEKVLNYFAADPYLLFEGREYFFANLITHRYDSYAYKSAYEACEKAMISFAYDSAARGKNNELLNMIYAQALQSSDDKDLRRVIFRTLFVKRLECNSADMAKVLIFHKELKGFSETALESTSEGSCFAYVNIYSENVLILFKDATGNLYKNIDFSVTGFSDSGKLFESCIKDIPVSALMLIGKGLEYVKKNRKPSEVLSFLLENYEKSEFTKEYEQALTASLFEFYTDRPVDGEIYETLMAFLDKDIGSRPRAVLIELMIERKRYNEALDEIKKGGFDCVSPKSLAALTHVLVQLKGEEEKEFLSTLCEAYINADINDTEILRYMCRSYDGSLDTLLLLYEKSSRCEIYNLSVAERILIKSAREQKEPDILPLVFARCYEESTGRALIREFLEYSAKRYLYGADLKSLNFFVYFGRDLARGIDFSDSAKAAWLLYMRQADDVPAKTVRVLQNTLCGLVYKGIMFEEFKDFKKLFPIPSVLSNTHIVSVISSEPVLITYQITSDKVNIDRTEQMPEILPGCRAKYFTVLFPEHLTYKVERGKSVSVNFSDIEWHKDGTRFSMVNAISHREYSGNKEAFEQALKEYYIRDELIERLF